MSISQRLRHAYKRLRGINIKIRKRRAKGQKTPELAKIRRHVRKKIAYLEAHKPDPPASTTGIGTYDGHSVAAWFIPWLEKIRARGRWTGVVVSGYRSPEYSTSLCYAICGAPRCPGRCAGASSNHSGVNFPGGAIDVTDYYTFAAEARAIGAPFHNGLPSTDPVHFSNPGN